MILSVSRRTDIPNYYSDWFYNRIREGFVYVRNPMNRHQISKIDLSPAVVDCIVFWTKNPEPMLDRMDELTGYPYYFQFTLTGYGNEIESNVPHKMDKMIPVFQKLSEKIGKQRVIWRYDPIIFTRTYTPEYHLYLFEQFAGMLKGYTTRCVISFVDLYVRNKKNMELLGAYELDRAELLQFSKRISQIAGRNSMEMGSCAEQIDLDECGIKHNSCIDKVLIENIFGTKLSVTQDKNQRPACGCMESVDIGTYNTCKNGCRYCYANHSKESVARNISSYDPASPILCGIISEEDRISQRKVSSWKEAESL